MRLRPLLAALLFGAAFATPARADDPRKPEAQKLLDEGLELHDKGREQEALEKFNAAYKIYPSPNLLFEIARTQKLLGNFVQALRNFRTAVKNDLLHPKNRALSLEHIAELEKLLARVEISGPPGTKVVVGDQTVTLPSSEPLDVEPGTVLASGSKDDVRYEGKVVAQTGKVARLELTPIGKATTSEGHPPDAIEPPPAGGETPSNKARWIVPGAIAAVGLVGVGTGVFFGLKSQSTKDEFDSNDCSTKGGPDCEKLHNRSGDESTVSIVGYVAGGALIAGAAVLWAVWPTARPTQRGSTWLAPQLGSGHAGATLGGTF